MTMVAPFTGAWIEILEAELGRIHAGSLPSRERGLKCRQIVELRGQFPGRSLHGSVD